MTQTRGASAAFRRLRVLSAGALLLGLLLGGCTGFAPPVQSDPERAARVQQAEEYFQQGEDQRLAGDYEAAIDTLNRALELDPDHLKALGSRGESYRAAGRYPEALADLNEALRRDPDYAWAYASRGETYRQMEDYQRAVADFSEAISRDPDYPWALGRRGEAYRMLDQLEPALADLDRAIELWPDDSYAYASRGQVHKQMGAYEAALTDFDRAIELDPDYQWAKERRAELLNAMPRAAAGSGRPTAAPPAAPPAPVDRGVLPLVAVLDFRAQNLPESDARLIVDLLGSALIRTRRYRVLERSQQEAILKEIEFSQSDLADESRQLQIGRLLSAEKIVVGSLGKVGGRYILNAKLLQVSSGEALASSYDVFPSLEALVDGCAAVAAALSEE